MLMTAIVVLFLIIIFISLMSALYYLIHDRQGSTRMVKALTVRIGLSLTLFILLLVSFAMGWIQPHAISRSLAAKQQARAEATDSVNNQAHAKVPAHAQMSSEPEKDLVFTSQPIDKNK